MRYVITGKRSDANYMDVFDVDVVLKMFASQRVVDRVGAERIVVREVISMGEDVTKFANPFFWSGGREFDRKSFRRW